MDTCTCSMEPTRGRDVSGGGFGFIAIDVYIYICVYIHVRMLKRNTDLFSSTCIHRMQGAALCSSECLARKMFQHEVAPS